MPDGQTAALKTESSSSFKASFINTELLYFRYLLGTIFCLGGGFGAALPLSSSIEKRKEILEPKNLLLYNEDTRYRTEQNGEVLTFEENEISNVNY